MYSVQSWYVVVSNAFAQKPFGAKKVCLILDIAYLIVATLNELMIDNKSFAQWVLLRADFRFAPSQWKTALLCINVSHWLGTNLESALLLIMTDLHTKWYMVYWSQFSYHKFNNCSSILHGIFCHCLVYPPNIFWQSKNTRIWHFLPATLQHGPSVCT